MRSRILVCLLLCGGLACKRARLPESSGTPTSPTGMAAVIPELPTTLPTPTSNIPGDMLAYWPLDGHANDGGGRWHGRVFGASAISDRHGIASGAMFFDGVSSFVDVGALHPPVAAFAVSFWMRPSNFTTTSGYLNENELLGDAGGNRGFRFMQIANEFYFQAQGGGGQASFQISPVEVGSWIHVAGVYGNGQILIYKNGALAARNTAGLMLQGTMPLQFGRDVNLSTSYWRGVLDEIRIYGRTLTAGEVAELSR